MRHQVPRRSRSGLGNIVRLRVRPPTCAAALAVIAFGGVTFAAKHLIAVEPLAADADVAQGSAASDPFGPSWPEGRGREETGYACIVCHSLAIVKQQRLSRDDWDELLEWMVEEQGMAPLSPERRRIVLDYLSAYFNVDRGR